MNGEDKPKKKDTRRRPKVLHRLNVQMDGKEWRRLKAIMKRMKDLTPTSATVTQRAVVLAALHMLQTNLEALNDEQLTALWQQEAARQEEEQA